MPQLPRQDLATLYGVYRITRVEQRVRGNDQTEVTKRVARSLQDCVWSTGSPPSCEKKKAVRRWFARWDANNGNFEDENRVVTANKARTKVTSPIKVQLRAKLKEPQMSTHQAAQQEYVGRCGVRVRLHFSTITKLRRTKLGLSKAAPKEKQLVLTAHHRRIRLLYARHKLTLTDQQLHAQLFGDEKGYGKAVKPNRKNVVQYCEPGQEAITNVHTISRYDGLHMLNMFLVISSSGVFYSKIFEGEFTNAVYSQCIREMQPLMAALRRRNRGQGFSMFVHDSCMKGAKPVAELDRCFGQGKWTETPPPPCKRFTGTVTRKFVRRRGVGHWREYRDWVYREVCTCNPRNIGRLHAAKAPELNIVEQAINMHSGYMYEIQKRDGVAEDKVVLRARMEECLRRLDANKDWFRDTYAALRLRYELVVEANGAQIDA